MALTKKSLFYSLLVGIFIYQLIWILIGAYYSSPNAEDLSVAVLARDKGVFFGAVTILQTFDGRYTVNLLHGLNPLAFDGYYANRWVAVFTVFISLISVYHLLNVQFKNKKRVENLIYALGFVTLFFSILHLSQSLYWMICSFVYIYPLILFLNFYTFFLKYISRQKNIDYALSVLFLFLAVGCCELYLPLFGIFLLLLFFQNKDNSTNRKIISWYILIYVASFLLFVTSPGIIYRFNQYEKGRTTNILELIPIALKYLTTTFQSLNYIPFILFIFFFNLEYNIEKKKLSNSLILVLSSLLALLLWIIILFLMGDDGFQIRLLPIFVALFAITFFKISPSISIFFQPIKNLLGISLILLLILIPNSYTAIKKDYQSGKLQAFKQEMDRQYLLLTKTKEKNTDCFEIITLKNLQPIIPNSIATLPYIKPNREDDFWNRAYENYFRIDEVRLEKDTIHSILKRTNEVFY